MADRKRLKLLRGPWENRPLLDLAEPAVDLDRLGENVLVIGNGTATPDEALMRDARQILIEKLEHHILPTSFGTTDTFCVTINIEPDYTSYLQGYEVFFISHQDSVTENVFIKVNNLAPILVKDILGQPVPRRYIRAGQYCAATFDGVNFRISAPVNVIPTIGDPLGPPVTIIVGAPNEPATLIEALDLLKEFIIQGPVTVIMRPVEEISTTYIWDHPDGHWVTLQGQPVITATGAMTSFSGGSGNYNLDLNLSALGGVPGDWVLCHSSSGTGDGFELVEGVHEITSASGAAVTLANKAQTPAMFTPGFTLSGLDCVVLKTIVQNVAAGVVDAFVCTTAITIRDCVFVGNGVTGGSNIVSIETWTEGGLNKTRSGGLGIYLARVGSVEARIGIVSQDSGKIRTELVGTSANDIGVAAIGGSVTLNYIASTGNIGFGIYCVSNGTININAGNVAQNRFVSVGNRYSFAQNSGYAVAFNGVSGISTAESYLQFGGIAEFVGVKHFAYGPATNTMTGEFFSSVSVSGRLSFNLSSFVNNSPGTGQINSLFDNTNQLVVTNSNINLQGTFDTLLFTTSNSLFNLVTISNTGSDYIVLSASGNTRLNNCTINSSGEALATVLSSSSNVEINGGSINGGSLVARNGAALTMNSGTLAGPASAGQPAKLVANNGSIVTLNGVAGSPFSSSPPTPTIGNNNSIVVQ